MSNLVPRSSSPVSLPPPHPRTVLPAPLLSSAPVATLPRRTEGKGVKRRKAEAEKGKEHRCRSYRNRPPKGVSRSLHNPPCFGRGLDLRVRDQRESETRSPVKGSPRRPPLSSPFLLHGCVGSRRDPWSPRTGGPPQKRVEWGVAFPKTGRTQTPRNRGWERRWRKGKVQLEQKITLEVLLRLSLFSLLKGSDTWITQTVEESSVWSGRGPSILIATRFSRYFSSFDVQPTVVDDRTPT